MYIINIKDAKELKTPHGKSVRWLLSTEIGVPNFEMRYFEVTEESKPSEDKHPWEHEVFVVRGEGIVKAGGEEEPFGFICVIPKGCEDHIKEKKN